jgi:hypothetical protein
MDIKDLLTVTRRMQNGAVTAMITYRSTGREWTTVVFPSVDEAEAFAISSDMVFEMTPEVRLQLRLLQESLGEGN